MPAIAWVESPLQLIGAAEWAAHHDRRLPLVGRLTPHMAETADELIHRGALFGETEPYLGIPWRLLSRHPHWIIGDGFSGQFRLAASVLRPRRVTFLDDGANTVSFADTLIGLRPYTRPGVVERGLTTAVVPFALGQVLGRARAGGVQLFTAFELGERRSQALEQLGVQIQQHRFGWTRATARPFSTSTAGRVMLGSARPVDGRIPLADYLEWVRAESAEAPITYLPHRRESAAHLNAVASIPGSSSPRRRFRPNCGSPAQQNRSTYSRSSRRPRRRSLWCWKAPAALSGRIARCRSHTAAESPRDRDRRHHPRARRIEGGTPEELRDGCRRVPRRSSRISMASTPMTQRCWRPTGANSCG